MGQLGMKKLNIIALSISLLGATLTEARPSISSIIPGLPFLINHASALFIKNPALAFMLQFVPHKTFVLSKEQTIRAAETLEDHDELDLSKISVEHDPVVFPENKEMVTVYADYKPEFHAESRLEKARELRNWHAKTALATGLLTHFAFKYKPTDATHKTMLKAIPSTIGSSVAWLNMGYSGYKAWQVHELKNSIKAAQNGDGDVARALERKAIAYQIQDME